MAVARIIEGDDRFVWYVVTERIRHGRPAVLLISYQGDEVERTTWEGIECSVPTTTLQVHRWQPEEYITAHVYVECRGSLANRDEGPVGDRMPYGR